MIEGEVAAARRELMEAYGSELVADFAIAGLGSNFRGFVDSLERFGPAEHETAGDLGLQLYYAHADAGDELSAQVVLEMLIDHGPPVVAARATVCRAAHFARLGDHERAEKLYLSAMDSGDAVTFALAGYNLAEQREERGDVAGAISAYRRVLESGAGLALAGAGLRLGGLLAERGDLAGARAAYEQGARVDHPDGGEASIALMNLLLGDLGDEEVRAAVDVARHTIEHSSQPEAVAYACNLVGMAAKDAGDLGEAERWLRRAAELDQPISEFAREALAEVLGDA